MTDILHAWRLLVVSAGAFTIGFALYIGWLYHKGHLRSGIYGRGRHVTLIMASYVLLAGELIVEIAYRAIHGDPITWRLPVATVAFALGSWALYQLIKTRATQARDKPQIGGDTDA